MSLNESSRSSRQILFLASLLLTLSGCVTSGAPGTKRQLPATPDWVKPVAIPDPAPDTPWIVAAGRYKASLLNANRIIVNVRDWNTSVREDYAK